MPPKTINRASSATNTCLLIHLQHRQAGPPQALGQKGLQLSLDGRRPSGPKVAPRSAETTAWLHHVPYLSWREGAEAFCSLRVSEAR